jgi:hypothetical protein
LSAIWNLSQHRSVKSEGATGAVTWESRFFPELFIGWRLTAKKRMVGKLKAVKAELQHWMHEPVTRVGEWLQRVAAGYYHYHAVPGNLDRLRQFRHRLRRLWRRVLTRRSQRGKVSWQRLNPLLDRWSPIPRVLHPYPEARFAARHPR